MTTPSVYDKVKHLMIPLRKVTPEHEAWISRVTDTVAAFTKDVFGDDDELHMFNSFAIHTAADIIWDVTDGRPCWYRLEVDEYMRFHAESPTWCDEQHVGIVATMMMFFQWLADTKRLRRGKAARVIRRFARYHSDELFNAVVRTKQGKAAGSFDVN